MLHMRQIPEQVVAKCSKMLRQSDWATVILESARLNSSEQVGSRIPSVEVMNNPGRAVPGARTKTVAFPYQYNLSFELGFFSYLILILSLACA